MSTAHPARLVFVNRYFFPDESATSRILSDLAFRLAEWGVPVWVFTSRQLYDNPRAELPQRETVRGVRVRRIAAATLGRTRLWGRTLDYVSFHAAVSLQLLRVLRTGDVLVVKTDPPLLSLPLSHIARMRGALLVNWLQDLFPEVATALGPNALPGWLGGWLTAARDRSLRRAVANIVLSESMRSRLQGRQITAASIHVIPNWADVRLLQPKAAAESRSRETLQLADHFVIGYSGNLGRAHDFDTLLGAARLLRVEPKITFLITGAGAKASRVRRTVENDGLSNVVFQELQPPQLLNDSLAAADVHVVSLLPALEGLIVPSKIYGILAVGRPVIFIGDPHGDLGKLVRRHGCGVAVQLHDSAALAALIWDLQEDAARLRSMGLRARALAESLYSSERAAADWIRLIAKLAPHLVPVTVKRGDSIADVTP